MCNALAVAYSVGVCCAPSEYIFCLRHGLSRYAGSVNQRYRQLHVHLAGPKLGQTNLPARFNESGQK